MPVPTPFHPRTAPLCVSHRWKDWAGYCAVCSYDTNHDREYFAFRHAAGMLDVSPLFKYVVTGEDAADFLAHVASRDLRKIKVGQVSYFCLCDGQGKVIDDGTAARLADRTYRVTSASPSLRWLQEHSRGFRVAIEDHSETTAALAVQGPTSRDVLKAACGGDGVGALRFFRVAAARIGAIPVEISRTGYTGDLGYEVWMRAEDAVAVWDSLLEAGAPYGLVPAALDALDVTRVEAGFILQGVDYHSATRCPIESRKSSAFEVGLGWTVDLDREPFVGQQALKAEKERGSKWAMVGLEISWEELERLYEEHALPPHLPATAWRTAVPVYDGRRQIGRATSGTWSPMLKKNLALATVEARYAEPGTRFQIEHTAEYERRTVTATVVKRPFFDPERKRA
ncbi:MAG TPA: aminomethyltransferase family protein [Candidatus Polarisedimenticolia bacterium]|nr:aminomethyltransferase family protein [Candidatus Polarisedimenticolia bacterium]